MNAWIKFAMKNAGVIFIAMLLVLGGGLYAKSSMKMEDMPNVDIPYVQVVIPYPGATPDQGLEDIGKPMEQALSGLKNLKNLYLTAGNDYVAATLEFDLNQSVDNAVKDINSALATLQLPEGAQKPQVTRQGPNASPVYSFGITANTDQAGIQQYVDEQIKPTLSSVQGIASVDVLGTAEKKIYVKVDPDKLKQNNLTLDQVKQAIQASNIGIPAGQVTLDGKDLNVQVGKKITSLDDVKNIQLVSVEQDMSGLTDAFKSVGQGFNAVGSSMGKIGQGVGNLTKGQMLLQGEVQLTQAISGLTTKLAADNIALAGLPDKIKYAATPQEQAKYQAELTALPSIMDQEQTQLNALQSQFSSLQAQVKASGTDTASILQGMAGNQSANSAGSSDVKPDLNIHTVKLGDIANVNYSADQGQIITRLNGKPAVVTDIVAQPGTNVVDLVNQINNKLGQLVLPQGYKLTKLRDSSVSVKNSVNAMQREAILGALFAMLITFVFLRNWRSTLVAILSIPLSIFASLITLYALGYSLNIMTLAGIAVAVGRVVDDSIVVIENIYRRVSSSNERSADLVAEAAKEVGQAVTSSTITTVAVFAPLLFVPGIVGKYFAPFGITVVVSIVFSLLVALTVVPLLSKLFLLNLKHREQRDNIMQRVYRGLLGWALNHKLIISIVAILLVGASLALVSRIPQNFLPSEKTVSYSLQVAMPVGTASTKTDQVAGRIEQFLSTRKDIKSYETNIRGENLNINIELNDGVTKEDSTDFEQAVQKTTNALGQEIHSAALTPIGITGNGGLYMVLKGPDINALSKSGDMIVNSIRNVPGLADVNTNLSAVKPQLSIDVDPAKAAKNGLNPAMVAMEVRQMIDGDSVTKVVLNGNTIDVNLGLKVDNLSNAAVISNQTLTNMTGEQVKLSDVASVKVTPGPTSIERLNQQEYVSVTGRFTTDNSGGVQKAVDDKVKQLKLPAGITYSYEGEAKEMQSGFTNLGLAMGVAVLLVYMVMLVAFSEMLAPLAILFSLPFIFVGGLAGLYFSGESLGVPAMVGFLMLIGIVVTNAIVFVDRVLQNTREGMSTYEALLEAGATRLRPILMTAVATVCALLPLAVSQEGGIISRSLAIVVISGLTSSTLLTLLIVPVAYQALDALRCRIFSVKPDGGKSLSDVAK